MFVCFMATLRTQEQQAATSTESVARNPKDILTVHTATFLHVS